MSTGWYSNIGTNQMAYSTAWPQTTPYTPSPCSIPQELAPARWSTAYGGFAAPLPTPPVQTYEVEFPRSKKPRASKACDQCRNRKQRCDEGTPCSYCKESALVCKYQAPLPTRFDKVAELMTAWMAAHTEGLQALAEKLDKLEALLAEYRREERDTQPSQRTSGTQPESHSGRNKAIAVRDVLLKTSLRAWPTVRHLLKQSKGSRGPEQDTTSATRAGDSSAHTSSPASDTCGNDYCEAIGPHKRSRSVCQDRAHLGKRKRASSEETCGPDFRIRSTSPVASVGQLYQSFLDHFYEPLPFLDIGSLSLQIKRVTCRSVQHKSQRLDYSPRTAIVLLVLALGEVAQRRLHPAPPVPVDNNAPEISVPGMRFYSQAMRCAGAHLDGSDLVHAQIFLLAGLYKAQISRAGEAASWFAMAGRVLIHLIQRRHLCTQQPREELPRSDMQSTHSQHYDLILAAAWACIELEAGTSSDSQSHGSGLIQLAEKLPLPTHCGPETAKVAPVCKPDRAWDCFSARMTLLRDSLVRDSHFSGSGKSPKSILDALKYEAKALQHWRCSLVSELQWHDKDPPSKSSILAQLRASYWRTKIQLLLPFLDYALHILPERQQGVDLDDIAELRSQQVIRAIDTMYTSAGPDEILIIARLCVEAIKQNIEVFNGVAERSVTLNTRIDASNTVEHSLVLAAVFNGSCLESSIEEEDMHGILRGTITFLEKLLPILPTCSEDLETIVGIKNHLFIA